MSKWAKKHRNSGSIPRSWWRWWSRTFFFFFFRVVGSLSQPRLNIFTVGNMRVMICLGQGGLRSLSASSCVLKYIKFKFYEKPVPQNYTFTTLGINMLGNIDKPAVDYKLFTCNFIKSLNCLHWSKICGCGMHYCTWGLLLNMNNSELNKCSCMNIS